MDLIYNILSAFGSLPNWTRWVFSIIAVAALLGLSFTVSPIVAMIVIGGLLVVGLLVFGFLWIIKRKREKKAASFGSDLRGHTGTAPNQISDPAHRARLEELAQAFEKGIEKFRAAGKNLYDMPWYVIVGEPGAGKTEAIRHSNVGFPPGMQDEFQGVGGTINMNWWFTNHGVILDTAGRLLFEEVEPGQTGEWRVFLEMLRKHRINCPINGLLLAIPADSLIKDTPDEIAKKAGKIAQQLEQIQRQLDVRFPAYVVITKCDLLNGFREFFDDMVDPQAQHQMMGWSNPDPLDAPFRPELVDDHIYTVVARLRRRRQGLLLDPIARALPQRTDEVDRLYALPHSVSLVAPNLRQYLDTIFIAGAWSQRPLFLRGIYFTSSLREGSALDQELAQALRLSVDSLPEGRAWERERSYFLRDVFLEKSFRERGLVTRATNTKKLVLRRRLTLLGAGVAGLLALLGFSWMGFSALRSSVGTQSGYWARASDGWNGDTWQPVVQRDTGAQFTYFGDQPVGPGVGALSRQLFNEPELPLAGFHPKLHTLATTPLNVSPVFRPLSTFGVEIDRDRKRAQRVVYDGSVIKPLLDAARQKMSVASPAPRVGSEDAVREGQALLALIRLEAGVVNRREKRGVGAFTGEKLLPPLLNFASGPKSDPALVQTLDFTYAESGLWPADWTSGGSMLAENTAIAQGLARFLKDAAWAAQSRSDTFPLILKVLEEVKQFSRIENDLSTAAKIPAPVEKSDKDVFDAYALLDARRLSLDLAISQAKKAGLFEGGPVSLAAAYERLFRDLRLRFEIGRGIQAEVEAILQANKLKLAVAAVTGEKKDYLLFREIQEKLGPMLKELEEKFQPTLSDTELAQLRTFDEFYLADPQTGALNYETRWGLYEKAVKASPALSYAQTLDLVGQEWKPLAGVIARVNQIRGEVQGFQGQLQDKALAITGYCLLRAERVHSDEFCKAYLAQARDKLRKELRFPFVWAPMEVSGIARESDVVAAASLLERLKRDLDSPAFAGVKSGYRQPLVEFRQKLTLLDPIRDALLTPEKQLRLCTIMLLNRNEQFRLSGQQVAMEAYKAIELRVGTIDHATPIKRGAIGAVASSAATDVELGKFTIFEPFHFHFLQSVSDPRVLMDMPQPADWTAIRVLYERQARRIGDGRRWQFNLVPAAGKRLWFEFRFDMPLPEFDDWPTRAALGLGGQ